MYFPPAFQYSAKIWYEQIPIPNDFPIACDRHPDVTKPMLANVGSPSPLVFAKYAASDKTCR